MLGVTPRGLLILMILLALIVVLFIIIIVLAALWPRTYVEQAPIVCASPACLRAAAQVKYRVSILSIWVNWKPLSGIESWINLGPVFTQNRCIHYLRTCFKTLLFPSCVFALQIFTLSAFIGIDYLTFNSKDIHRSSSSPFRVGSPSSGSWCFHSGSDRIHLGFGRLNIYRRSFFSFTFLDNLQNVNWLSNLTLSG